MQNQAQSIWVNTSEQYNPNNHKELGSKDERKKAKQFRNNRKNRRNKYVEL